MSDTILNEGEERLNMEKARHFGCNNKKETPGYRALAQNCCLRLSGIHEY